ncbi:hypothetical protein MMYC01_210521, partial [Madurella mycetomatis]
MTQGRVHTDGSLIDRFPAAQTDAPLSDQQQQLLLEEQQLDEQIAIARREATLRRKRSELELLNRQNQLAPELSLPGPTVHPSREPLLQSPPGTAATSSAAVALPQLETAVLGGATWKTPTLTHPTYNGSSATSLRNFLFDCKANFRLIGNVQSSDRVTYAVSCLRGPPKNAWVKHITERENDPTFDPAQVTWEELVEFLRSQLSDPETRALSAATQLDSLHQRNDETVTEFVDRYTTITADLPYQIEDSQRIIGLLPKFRREIRLAITCQSTLPVTYQQLVSTARRIEDSQRVEGTSAYRSRPRYQ